MLLSVGRLKSLFHPEESIRTAFSTSFQPIPGFANLAIFQFPTENNIFGFESIGMFLRVVGGHRVPGVHKQFGIVDVQGWRGVPGSAEEHLEVLRS